LDILLSGADGRDLCIEIKSKDAHKALPIILFSAHTVVKDNFADFKADDFIEKPFEIDSLLETIQKHLPVVV